MLRRNFNEGNGKTNGVNEDPRNKLSNPSSAAFIPSTSGARDRLKVDPIHASGNNPSDWASA